MQKNVFCILHQPSEIVLERQSALDMCVVWMSMNQIEWIIKLFDLQGL